MGASNTSKVLQTQPDKKNKKNPPFFDKFYTYIYIYACMHACMYTLCRLLPDYIMIVHGSQ